MGSVNLLPIGDWRNDGWTLNGASNLFSCWDNDDDSKYARCPSHKGGATVSFPIDVSSVPDGAVITSVTVFLRAAKTSGSNRSITINVISADNESRYTSRTIYPTSTPTTYEIATYTTDPRGLPWDCERLNKMRFRVFSYSRAFDAIRCYKFFARVNYRVRPTVSVAAPTGTVYTPSPVISWVYSQADGDPQSKADYKIYTTQQVNSSTFNPARTPPVYSTTVTGDVSSVTLPTSLNPDTYAAYVRVRSSFGALSTWVGRSFEVKGPAPAIPGDDNAGVTGTPGIGVATVVADSYLSAAALTLRDASNLLSVQQADFETSTDPLEYTTTNCTIARDIATVFTPSVGSVKITAASAATMSVLSTMVEVDSSAPVTVRAQTRAGTTGRTVNLSVLFYDETFTSLVGTITGTGSDLSTTWTEIVATGSTPATAAYAAVKIEFVSTANLEVHYVDRPGLMYGTNSAWSHGGHMSRNLLSAYLATGDDPAAATGWIPGNVASTVSRVSPAGSGSHGTLTNRMTYAGVSPSLGFRATGATFTSPTSGTNFTLTKPVGVVDNDLMIAFVTSTTPATMTPPTGWTLVDTTQAEGNHQLWILKRTGLTSDPTTWTDGALSASSTRRSAVVVAYSGAAHEDDQFIAEAVRGDANGSFTHTTATLNNTDANAWRVAAFAARDNFAGGTMTANVNPPSSPKPLAYVGRATKWGSSSNSTSYTINKPTGVVSGDLMIAACSFASPSGITTVTPPAGWTLVRTTTQTDTGSTNGSVTLAILKRTAGASEPTSWSGTLSSAAKPALTEVSAYRNALDASLQFLAEGGSVSPNGDHITTATVTNTDSNSWRVCAFSMIVPDFDNADWTGGSEVVMRSDDGQPSSDQADIRTSIQDSNGPVGTGSHSRVGYGDTWFSAASWIGLVKAATSPPAAVPNETERTDFTNGSADPWETLAVYDSNAVVPAGNTSVTGVFTVGGGGPDGDSILSWIAMIKPASAVVAGTVSAMTQDKVDISQIDPKVFEFANHKITMTASFIGSAAGTPYLTLDFYRANQLIDTYVAEGTSFGTSTWVKSSATFDIPEGTTRVRPRVSATGRAVADTVSWDRVSVALGSSAVWRNGTSRDEHPVWSVPEIQFADDDGAGYGAWETLPGMSTHAPTYDPLTGQIVYTDHTIVPLHNRKYRIQTVSYGLAGDRYVSGYGPESDEVSFTAINWWLKDIISPENNMMLKVKAAPMDVGTTNTAVVFQPLGEAFPIVLTEGYKGDAVELTLILTRAEHAALRKLLGSGRTLLLQSDVDHAWWVRPVGDLQAATQVTGQRTANPIRFVTVTFVEVAPEL